MQLIRVSRTSYQSRHLPETIQQLSAQFPDYLHIPEGGTCEAAVRGVSELDMRNTPNGPASLLICAVGSGGTDTVELGFTAAGAYAMTLNVENATVTTASAAVAVNVTGNAGNNLITGHAGNNLLVGGLGNDTLISNGGIDTLDGTSGDDVAEVLGDFADYTVTRPTATDTVLTGINGAAGQVITLRNIDSVQFNDGSRTIEQLQFNVATIGNDTLTGASENDNSDGLTGNDSLVGGDGDDTLIGGAGNDTFVGGAGLDTISYVGTTGAVTFSLASTSAQNTRGAGSDRILSGHGVENLEGGSGSDRLTGDAAANRIQGAAGG